MHPFWTQFYFYACAATAVIGALTTVLMPNPIRGAMGLLLMILSLAGLFLAAHAQFLAAIQLIVYAGAIVVLFLFVIMLLGPDATPPHDRRGRFSRTFAGGLFALLSLGAMAAVVHGGMGFPATLTADDFGSIDHFGRVLFSYGVVPFELSSALLMVAVIGAVAVARGKDTHPKPKPAVLTESFAKRPVAAAPESTDAAPSPPTPSRPTEASDMAVPPYILLSGILFTIGAVGFLVRRNVLVALMSIEIMLNAVNLALVAFNRAMPANLNGQMFAFFIIAGEAAEVAVGLAIVLSLFRVKRTVRSDEADLLKN